MKKVLLLLSLLFFFSLPMGVNAQTCSPTRVVNQYACRNQWITGCPNAGGITGCEDAGRVCQFSGEDCAGDPNVCNDPGDGACNRNVCNDFCEFGWNCNVTSGTVSCSPAPDCSWDGSIRQCETQSGGSSCSERSETWSYECWVAGASCGNGSCQVGEDCASCPSDCGSCSGGGVPPGGGGSACSGDCFGGLSNCGEVGRVGASGSCNAGELCCELPFVQPPRSCQFYPTRTQPSNPIAFPADEVYRWTAFALGGSGGLPDDVCFRVSPGNPGFDISPSSDGTRGDGPIFPGAGYYETRIRSRDTLPNYFTRMWVYDDDDDNCGNGPEECEITVGVHFGEPGNNSPTMSIDNPTDGQEFLSGSDIQIDTTISDTDGTVQQARMRRGSSSSYSNVGGIINFPPFTWYYTNARVGNTRFFGYAVDDTNNLGWSNAVNVRVVNNRPPTCTVTSPLPGSTVVLGNPITITVDSNDPDVAFGDDTSRVNFIVNGVSIGDDISRPFSIDWTPFSLGNQDIRPRAYDTNGASTQCANVRVTSIDPNPWWQVIGGSVTVNRNLVTSIPPTCASDINCIDNLILDNDQGFPGIAAYGNTADFASGTGTGIVSSTGWLNRTTSSLGNYTYDYFANLASGRPMTAVAGTINNGDISSAPVDDQGYAWLLANGDLAINNPLNVSNKRVIVFVNDGDLLINDRVSVQDPSDDFVMFVVGSDGSGNKGDVIIDHSVAGSPATSPAVEGVFFMEGVFTTIANPSSGGGGGGGGGTPTPTVNLRVNNSNGPITVANGADVNLSWTSTDATDCRASGAWWDSTWTGGKPLSGSQQSENLTESSTYTIRCSNGTLVESAEDSVRVNITGLPAAPGVPSVELRFDGVTGTSTVGSGTVGTLSWTSSNVSSCTAGGDWSGSKGTSGSESSPAITSDSHFSLSCSGAGGNGSSGVWVNISGGGGGGGGGSAFDEQLIVRGSVAAMGGFNMQRDLGIANQNTPAELFIYAPEYLVNFPTALSDKHLIWQEVAP